MTLEEISLEYAAQGMASDEDFDRNELEDRLWLGCSGRCNEGSTNLFYFLFFSPCSWITKREGMTELLEDFAEFACSP